MQTAIFVTSLALPIGGSKMEIKNQVAAIPISEKEDI
jgi:hypothetical protein